MNSNKLITTLNIVRIALVVIGVGASLSLFLGPNVNDGTEAVAAFRDGAQLSTAVMFTIAVLLATVALIFVFFFMQLATNTKKTVMSIIGILAALVIYLIFFAGGTSDTSETLLLKNPVDDGTVATTTAGLYTVLVGFAVGILVIILGPFMGRFRK